MAFSFHDDVFDGGLNEIKDNANLLTICSSAPTTRTEAVTTYALADQALVGGDFTLADGTVSGRKLTLSEFNDVPVDTTGTGTHAAIVDGTRLLVVTEITSLAMLDTEEIDIPEIRIEFRDPVEW